MCAHQGNEGQGHGYGNLTGVAWSILVMGLSLAAVIILWVWFGHIGPTFSEDVLSEQQQTLRETFDLPAEEVIEDPEILQTPPSLRNVSEVPETDNNDSFTGPTNATTTTATTANGSSQESADIASEVATGPASENVSSAAGEDGNVTATATTTTTAASAPNETAASSDPATPSATEAATALTIPQGASVQGSTYYEPDPLTIKVGDTIAVDNQDIAPHTVTNGKDATDPDMGNLFDTSIINAGESGELVTTDLEPGEYPYFCTVHPYMVGTLTVQ